MQMSKRKLKAIVMLLIMAVPAGICVKWLVVKGPLNPLELIAVMCITTGVVFLNPEHFPELFDPERWVQETLDKWFPEKNR